MMVSDSYLLKKQCLAQQEYFSDKYKIKWTQIHLFIAFQMFPENSKPISKPENSWHNTMVSDFRWFLSSQSRLKSLNQ